MNMLPNMTKGALQKLVKDLEMGDDPDYLGGPNMITTVLKRGKRKQQGQSQRRCDDEAESQRK